MDNNELLRQLRKALAANETTMADLLGLAGAEISPSQMRNWLRQANEAGFEKCPDQALNQFLDALIQFKRGTNNSPSPADAAAPSNNLILKKLRIAFDLKDPDMLELFQLASIEISKQELKSLFRTESHKNFKACSDKQLRGFLQGLIQHCRSTQRPAS